MKQFNSLFTFFVLLAAFVFSNLTHFAFAQSPRTAALEWHAITIKNVKPHLLAYWIDPAHQSMPEEYQKRTIYMNHFLPKSTRQLQQISPEKNNSVNVLAKPLGTTIFADDAEKVLWVRATQKQFDEIKLIVDFLDRPIRKINIDFKMVKLDPKDIAKIQNQPLVENLFSTEKQGSISYSNLTKAVTTLIDEGKAKVIGSSQLSISNNLTDRYTKSTSVPATVEIKPANNNVIPNFEPDQDHPLFLESHFSAIFTPTINNDDTLTVFFTTMANLQLTHQASATNDDAFWIKNLYNPKTATTVFTIKNNHTIMLTGYTSTMLGLDQDNSNVVFLIKGTLADG